MKAAISWKAPGDVSPVLPVISYELVGGAVYNIKIYIIT
jgi:hypothetical protein